jgi:hypothetical protein
MQNNIDASLRALCQAQEAKIKAQHLTIHQFQLGIASVGTLAANYKADLDKMIRIADLHMEAFPDCVFGKSIEHAKEVSASNGTGPADAILNLSAENNRLRKCIAGYQTHQDQLEAELAKFKANEI